MAPHVTDTQNFSLPPEKPEISSNYKIDGCKLEANINMVSYYYNITLKDVRIITNLNT